ncbi:bestrophin-like domain [Desulfonatronum parangueonense]
MPENVFEWVAVTPFLIAFLVLAIPSVVLSVIGIILIRIAYPPMARMQSQIASGKVNYMAETYAVVLGFFLVTAYEMYQEMQTTVNTEAMSVRALDQVVRSLPAPLQQDLTMHLEAYAHTVVEEEWPLLTFGLWSPQAQAHLDAVFLTVGKIAAGGAEHQASALQAEQLARHIMLNRADRIAAGPGDILGGKLSYVLLVATLIAFAMPWFLFTPYLEVHIILGVLLVVVFISLIVMSAKLMYPFAGELTIPPELLQDYLTQVAGRRGG